MILPGAERLRTIAERLAALDVAQTAIAAEQRALLDELRRVAGEPSPAEDAPYASPARKLIRAKAAAGDLKISERTLCRWLAKFPRRHSSMRPARAGLTSRGFVRRSGLRRSRGASRSRCHKMAVPCHKLSVSCCSASGQIRSHGNRRGRRDSL